MKRNIIILFTVVSILIIFSALMFASGAIDVKDYIKGKLPSIFSFYLSSLEDLDSYEKEFIDLFEKLPEEEQEYYAKDVYKNGFSLKLLEEVKTGKKVPIPISPPPITTTPQEKPVESPPSLINVPQEKPIESLPSLIKRIKPSTVIIFAYDDKGEFLKLGSGFFVNQNGDIITNYHVVQGTSSAEIKTSDGKVYSVTYIVAEDEQNDIIRLSVNIPSQYVYPLSLSKTIPEVGERIIVYGSPLGLENTVSDGIVSAVREIPDFGKIIQITAPISPGSSGSPVLNMNGEVIGIATFQMIEGQNLNFAIPSERIASLNLVEEEKIFTTEELFEEENKEKKDSDYALEAYNKARYFMDKEEYEKALPCWEIAANIDFFPIKIKAIVYHMIGFCYNKLGNHSKAMEAYKQAIHINPDYAYAWNDLGVNYKDLGHYENALEAFKQAIRIDPDDEVFHFNLGLTFVELGIDYAKQGIQKNFDEAFKQAIEAFKQAIRIDPDNADAHYGLGGTYFFFGDRNSALNEYKILKELDIDTANKLFDMIYE